MELLLSNRSECNEGANNDLFGVVADCGVIQHKIHHGEVLDSGCVIVPSDPILWRLSNYKVSSAGSGMVWLVPVQAPIVAGKAGTVDAADLHSLRMGDGEGKPTRVIDGDKVKMYVGFGWVELRTADQLDSDIYPVVVRSK
jgi:hypothetical protein